jgi:hypothetical protein
VAEPLPGHVLGDAPEGGPEELRAAGAQFVIRPAVGRPVRPDWLIHLLGVQGMAVP